MNARVPSWFVAVAAVAFFALGALTASVAHRPAPRPAAPPPAAPHCDGGIKVWPGAGVFPVPECAQP
jgi:hypothetical protein